MKVAVLGAAGGIGQPLSMILKNNLPAGSSLSLFDVAPFTPGVAKDLSHIPTDVTVDGFTGDDLTKALEGADVVVIPAGVARKPGMTRDDLFNINAGIIANLVRNIAKTCPKACICIITNPVNSTVPLAAEVLKEEGVYDKHRLFGISVLDVLRSETFLAEELGISNQRILVPVVGGHSGTTIVPLISKVIGHEKISQKRIEELTYRIQNAGTEVVEAKAGAGSATLSMATAGAHSLQQLLSNSVDLVEYRLSIYHLLERVNADVNVAIVLDFQYSKAQIVSALIQVIQYSWQILLC